MTAAEAGRPPRQGRIRRALARTTASVAGLAAATRLFGKPAPEAHRFDEASGRGDPSTPPSETAVARGHETRDMSGGLMMWLVVGLAVSVSGMIGLMLLLVGSFRQERVDHPPRATAEQVAALHPPGPNLQSDPVGDLARLHAREQDLLQGYAWIDSGHVRARIPIGQAMTLMVGRTLDPVP